MVNKSLEEIALQEASWQDTVRKEIVKRYIYKRSNLLATGTKIIPTEFFSDPDVVWEYPEGDATVTWPTPIEATSGRGPHVTWQKFGLTLEMGEFKYMISDTAKLRGQAARQRTTMVRKGGESFAKKIDNNILDTLISGKGQTVAVAGGSEWDTASPDIIGNIVEAWGKILDQSNVTEAEMSKVHIVVPTNVWAYLMKVKEIHNISQSTFTYLQKSYGLKFHASRELVDDDLALMVVNSPETAVHGVLRTNAIPLSETRRIHGRGTEWIVRKFFHTKVIPESSTVSTNNRICTITNVHS